MRFRIIFPLLFLSAVSGISQTSQTPYSSKGLGEIIYPGIINNTGMGGVSIAYPSNINFNLNNPALLSINNLTTFEVGFIGERRTIRSDTLRQNNGSGNLGYLAFSFPVISGYFSSGFSLTPYSYVNYNIQTVNPVYGSSDSVQINYKGSGGVNNLSWSNGFLLFKSLAMGVKLSYMFGSITDETVFDLAKVSAYKTALYTENNIRDFNVSLGTDYRLKLSETMAFHLGAIYETSNEIKIFRTERLERRRPDNDVMISSDTIMFNEQGSAFIPEKLGAGLSLVKSGRWMVALEYQAQDWSKYMNFSNSNDNLVNSSRYAGGIEFVPDMNSIDNYFLRAIYRAGFSYTTTQYLVGDAAVSEIGINFGVSLPVGRTSLVNLAVLAGNRGNNTDLAIKENYLRISLGFTYNDKWFIRRRID